MKTWNRQPPAIPPFPGRRFALALGTGIPFLAGLAVAISAVIGFDEAAIENGFLEVTQTVFLALAVIFHLAAAVRYDDATRLLQIGAAILCTFFFLREFEVEPDEVSPILQYLASRQARIDLAILLVPLLGPYIVIRRTAIPVLLRYASRLGIWPFLLAALLLAGGGMAEKLPQGGDSRNHWQFVEEFLELLGYAVLLAFPLWLFRLAPGIEPGIGRAQQVLRQRSGS